MIASRPARKLLVPYETAETWLPSTVRPFPIGSMACMSTIGSFSWVASYGQDELVLHHFHGFC